MTREQAIKLSYKFYDNKKFYLEVRTWIKSAVKCHEKVGFEIVNTIKQETYFGQGEVLSNGTLVIKDKYN